MQLEFKYNYIEFSKYIIKNYQKACKIELLKNISIVKDYIK